MARVDAEGLGRGAERRRGRGERDAVAARLRHGLLRHGVDVILGDVVEGAREGDGAAGLEEAAAAGGEEAALVGGGVRGGGGGGRGEVRVVHLKAGCGSGGEGPGGSVRATGASASIS